MKYPKFLSIGNWLFVHISPNPWEKNPFGGAVPANLYACCFTYGGIELNLSRDLRTYDNLVAVGATEPDDEELLRLIKK